MRELILGAITDFNGLLSLLEKKERSKVGGSFRSRCRELPSLIEDIGLVPALSFCFAKATKKVYDNVKNLLEKRELIKDEDHMKRERSYGIYLYLVLKRLKELTLIGEDGISNPIKALEDLGKGKGRVASKLIRPYIIQLKKLSEATFEAERV